MLGLAGGLVGCRQRAAEPEGAIRLWLGGDVHLGARGSLHFRELDFATRGARGVVNLEGPVVPHRSAPDGPGQIRLHNAPETLPSLKRAGVAVVGIANNHDRDGGDHDTTARALAAAGMVAAHPAAPAAEAGRWVVTAHDLSAGIPPDIVTSLQAARASAGVLIATFHVTGPPSFVPRPELREAVGVALAAGARVVAAHGTHAIGPVERCNDAVIAWGLGNLAFACDCTDERDGALLRVAIQGDRIEAVVIPVDASLDGGAVRPARDPSLMLDLFAAIGSSPLARGERSASF